MTLLPNAPDYDTLVARFRWQVPEAYNIAEDVCDQWAASEPDRTALIEVGADGSQRKVSYLTLMRLSNRLANGLAASGVGAGDRVAVFLPQGLEVAVSHIAIYKLGAIALPLANVFGPEAISFRLANAGVRAIVTDGFGAAKVETIREGLPDLALVISTDGAGPGNAIDFAALVDQASDRFATAGTSADDPAMMIYTSGTTGPPKGALHGHRVLLGHIPGVQMHHDFLPRPGDRLWTPADWAWAGGLLNVLLPALKLGVPVIARRFDRFDPDEAWRLMVDAEIRNAFIPPTALRMLKAGSRPPEALNLRSVGSGGEALGQSTFDWGHEALGLTINEFYGQTECNLVLSSCAALGINRAGAIGRAVPGHRVAIVDDDGTELPPGSQGTIAVQAPDPVMFLSYWGSPEATRDKFRGDWLLTGDQGVMDKDGYVRFVGRDDDVITSSGYRIGPGEIEDCLIGHPAVSLAAVVGKPDPVRTEIVKAFVQLRPGMTADETLVTDIQTFVRERLSAHEYPREIEFVDEMPLTTTGKVIRRAFRDRVRSPGTDDGGGDG
ncbi:AMP-binding protein [Amorphus orientalis]|uniref:Acetyl-CoA synthetase n=1 Tax=Amorphus orientalis TaxID=649198 RepID=A0AAE4ARC2_9HYPH|nr:AMP-binding protein [Amorphus orientalis]MDQ0314052.1 acetyl-CoA synthetase [Amorphus orientalis]